MRGGGETGLEDRQFGFDVERAIFARVRHRLCGPDSDRACERWMPDYTIPGADRLQLQHFYRAMACLGEPLPDGEQDGPTPFPLRCTKDLIEEALFTRRHGRLARRTSA